MRIERPKQEPHHFAAICALLLGAIQFVWSGVHLAAFFREHGLGLSELALKTKGFPYLLVIFLSAPLIVAAGASLLRGRTRALATAGGLLSLIAVPYWWEHAWYISLPMMWLGYHLLFEASGYFPDDEQQEAETVKPGGGRLKGSRAWLWLLLLIFIPAALGLGLLAVLFVFFASSSTTSVSMPAAIAVVERDGATAEALFQITAHMNQSSTSLSSIWLQQGTRDAAMTKRVNELTSLTGELSNAESGNYKLYPHNRPPFPSEAKQSQLQRVRALLKEIQQADAEKLQQNDSYRSALQEVQEDATFYTSLLNQLCLLTDDKLNFIEESYFRRNGVQVYTPETVKNVKATLAPYRMRCIQAAELINHLPPDQTADFFQFCYPRLSDPENLNDMLAQVESTRRNALRTELERLKSAKEEQAQQKQVDEKFREFMDSGDKATAKGDYAEAEHLYLQALQLKPAEAMPQERLARLKKLQLEQESKLK